MADRFEDHRGVIQDVLPGPIDCVTHISTVRDAVRGNHSHAETWQWTWILAGRLLVVTEKDGYRKRSEHGPGEMITDEPGTIHAWKALTDCEVLVFTRGPRSGQNYEEDVQRLEKPILT